MRPETDHRLVLKIVEKLHEKGLVSNEKLLEMRRKPGEHKK